MKVNREGLANEEALDMGPIYLGGEPYVISNVKVEISVFGDTIHVTGTVYVDVDGADTAIWAATIVEKTTADVFTDSDDIVERIIGTYWREWRAEHEVKP